MRRKERQKKKYLGHRSFGRGNVKNRRGSGNRGGRGKAGRDKHKFTWITAKSPGYFGRDRFYPVNSPPPMPVLHLYEVQQNATAGRLEQQGGNYRVEFQGKVLSTGKISVPVSIRALAWSKRCEEKIKKSGGSIEKIEKIGKIAAKSSNSEIIK